VVVGFVPIIHISVPQILITSPRLARLAHLLVRPGKMGMEFSPGSNQERWRRQQRQRILLLTNTFSRPTARPHPTRALLIERPEARCASLSTISCRYRRDAGLPPHICKICLHVRERRKRPSQTRSSQQKLRRSANNNRCSPFSLVFPRSYSDRSKEYDRKSP
jgi:hypothetical protein